MPRKVQHSGRGRAFANFGLGCIAGAFLHGLAALGVIVATLGGTPLSLVVVGVDVAALVLLLVGGQRAAALGYVAALALVVAVPLVGIGLRLLSVVIP